MFNKKKYYDVGVGHPMYKTFDDKTILNVKPYS